VLIFHQEGNLRPAVAEIYFYIEMLLFILFKVIKYLAMTAAQTAGTSTKPEG